MTTLSTNDFKRLAQLVGETTGNRVQNKNFAMLESRMSTRLLRLGIASMAEYWVYFDTNEALEREAIQSLMTTHHTFFFREYTHFEILEKWISDNLASIKERYLTSKTPLKIWSAACSRGQEVYSLAMFLEPILFKKHGIEYLIVGTDIDRESVAYAKNGVYPIKEVNTIPRDFLNGYWKRGTGAISEFVAVQNNLKAKTRFEALSLLETEAWKDPSVFDVIFCRNVFIYFSDADVEKISMSLVKKLRAGGLFVSGVSEPLRFKAWNLQSIGPSVYVNGEVPVALKSSIPALNLGKTASPKVIAPATDSYRVLIVDDSSTIQVLMKKIFLSDPSCKGVESAMNGREARERLNAQKFDLITLDIHMPEVNGIEFLERLYQRKTDPPVIMVSSVNRTDIELASKSLGLGAFDYVEKPAMNNLQTSKSELLMKAKLAMRSKPSNKAEVGAFDSSIAQAIVIPEASQCLRVVVASLKNIQQLEAIVMGQETELRSPPLVIMASTSDISELTSKCMQWTPKTIVTLRDVVPQLKASHIYFSEELNLAKIIGRHQFKKLSLQVLEIRPVDCSIIRGSEKVQLLVDDSLAGELDGVWSTFRIRVSDVVPATSFPSISIEFFAHLRRLAA